MTRAARKLFGGTPSWLLFALSAVLCLAGMEAAVRVSGRDIRAACEQIYTMEGDYRYTGAEELYRDCADAERLYELVPGVNATCRLRHEMDRDRGPARFSIDEFGFRRNGTGVAHARRKPAGVFRIMAVGGSNTYGPLVSDSETWPARLEQELERRAPGRFEVWNAGLNAYNMTQKVVYARTLVRDFDPDLILFQHNNTGRRAFFYKADFARFFRGNSDLWCENVPLIWFDSAPDPDWHLWLVRRCALYRLCVAKYDSFLVNIILKGGGNEFLAFCMVQDKIYGTYYSVFANMLSSRRFHAFAAECRGPGAPKTAIIFNWKCRPKWLMVSGMPKLFIGEVSQAMGKAGEYRQIHPPAHVYEWYAGTIAEWLEKEGLVSFSG